MKTRILSLILTLALLLSAFAGCVGENESVSGGAGAVGTSHSASGPVPEDESRPEPDYSDFVMPEETDTLVLYSRGWAQDLAYDAAVPIFEELYPGVHVELRKFTEDEFDETVRAEIPAGKGPDLLFASPGTTLPDVYKTMDSGVFEDLNPYIYADESFSLDDYVRGVMDAGLFRGQRFILPVAQDMLILTSSAELLAEEGITLGELGTLDGFVSVCGRYRERNPGKYFFDDFLGWNPQERMLFTLAKLYEHSGLRFMDYENRTVVLDRDLLKTICDLCILYSPEVVEKEMVAEDKNLSAGNMGIWDMILKRKRLFYDTTDMGIDLMMIRYAIRKGGETPVSLLLPAADGEGCSIVSNYGAIPKGAKNKLNAWRFLKILLSPAIQGDSENAMRANSPVLKSAIKFTMEDQGYPDEDIDALADALTDVSCAYMLPPVQWVYLRDHMKPYLYGEKSFDACFDGLMNELELYIDE